MGKRKFIVIRNSINLLPQLLSVANIIKGGINLSCNKCKNNSCEYKINEFSVPCESCIYEKLSEYVKVCKECINGKCQLKRKNKDH